MPILVEDAAVRDPLRLRLRAQGIQTSVLYPAVHEFTAYRDLAHADLPHSERVARTQVTLPLYPHLTEADQDRVVAALRRAMAAFQP
jgi:dTDP-4-amino-4,6-dideoxygalactose transaminase